MQNKLKFSAILLTLIIALMLITSVTANAMTFNFRAPSFGLYCENENADISGEVKYIIDENGNAVQYSEYTVNAAESLFVNIPFISKAYELPETNITVNGKAVPGEVRYGGRYYDDIDFNFYTTDLYDNLTGTLYSLKASTDSFKIHYKNNANRNFIYNLTNSYKSFGENGGRTYILENAQPNITYELFVIGGDFTEFESDAETTIEKLTVKQYIDRNFEFVKEYYYDINGISPDLLYALINGMIEQKINYIYSDFFFSSFSEQRLNSYSIELNDLPCVIKYAMPVKVQANATFKPEIYLAEQKATENYSVNYTIELNSRLPYIIESNAELKKQGNYVYTARNISDDFYFVYSSSQKPESIYGNTENNTLKIVLYVVLSVVVCALIIVIFIAILRYKKTKRTK